MSDSQAEIERLSLVRDRLNRVSPSFCLAKWFQVTMHLFSGNTQSCHHVKSHRVGLDEIAKTPSALHNSCIKKQVRSEMRKGEFPSECDYCWRIEKTGAYSDRTFKSSYTWALPSFDVAAANPPDQDVFPTNVEIAFSNVCNFKCLYCTSAYSTSWEQEIKRFGPYPRVGGRHHWSEFPPEAPPLEPEMQAKYVEAFWKWWPELSPHLSTLRVTGGEPLLSPDTWKLFELLAHSKYPKMTFAVNSNLGASDRHIDRLISGFQSIESNVREIMVYCSLDTVGPQAEYLRTGLKFDRFIENVERILSDGPPNLKIVYMITVNALSLPGLKDLLEIIDGQRARYGRARVMFDTPYLRYPEYLSVFILPTAFAKHVDACCEFMKTRDFHEEEIHKLARIASLMRDQPMNLGGKLAIWAELVVILAEADRRRGTNYRKTFPEFASLFTVGSVIARVRSSRERSSKKMEGSACIR